MYGSQTGSPGQTQFKYMYYHVYCMQERERERERRAHDASVYLPTRVNRSAMRLDLIRMSIGASLQRLGGYTRHTNHRMHTNVYTNTDEHAWY